jgi:hypothetical protein
MLTVAYVGPLLVGVRSVSKYALRGGQRVPSVAEMQWIKRHMEFSLGCRLPDPAVQLVPLSRTAGGQAAHLLVQVPTAAVAKQLVEQGISPSNGLFMRFEKHKPNKYIPSSGRS